VPEVKTRRLIRATAVTSTALGCALVAVGLGLVPVEIPLLAGQTAAPLAGDPLGPGGELRVPASEATWVFADDPAAPAGPVDQLRAGDTDGGAVIYLKFEIPDDAQRTGRALLRLTPAAQPLPSLVELVSVPDTTWVRDTLTWASAPLLGPVVQSVQPEQADEQVVFDVTDLVRSGSHAFAVTVPPDRGHATFVGEGDDMPVLSLSGGSTAPTGTPPAGSQVPTLSAAPEDVIAPPIPPVRSSPPATGPPATGPPASSPPPAPPECAVGERLVPSCGVLWGVAPDQHTGSSGYVALTEFERITGRRQDIYHSYHRAQSLFPTAEEVAIAGEGRILFLNWKPLNWSWAQIARGHPTVDAYLDRLADHINSTFTDPFFFTIHHEPENDVRARRGSGWEPADYAAMYRHTVERLRANGVDNLVSVMDYMAYVPWNTQPWFPELYPGDDVVDWIAWNAYAYSDPGYGYGDFGELLNRRSEMYPSWPGFYTWATHQFPDKPFMLGEWGVWYSRGNPEHMARFYDSVARQTPLFPRVKAMVYYDTPSDQRARDSRPTRTEAGLAAYQQLGSRPYFQVRLEPASSTPAPSYR
jgi:hypothetical protein